MNWQCVVSQKKALGWRGARVASMNDRATTAWAIKACSGAEETGSSAPTIAPTATSTGMRMEGMKMPLAFSTETMP
jgi:hypothetical protein